MLTSFILAVIIAAALIVAQGFFHPELIESDDNDVALYAAPIAIAIGVGAINYLTPKLTGQTVVISVVFLMAMIALYGYLAFIWHMEGQWWKEMIPFIVVAVLMWFTTKAVAVQTSTLVNRMAASLINVIPTLCLIASVGFYIAIMYLHRYEDGIGLDRRYGRKYKTISRLVAILCGVLLVAIAASAVDVNGFISKKASSMKASADEVATTEVKTEEEVADEASAEEAVPFEVADANVDDGSTDVADEADVPLIPDFVHFYNLDNQDDGIVGNEFDFAPNQFIKGNLDSDYYAETFADIRHKDPNNLASACLALDSVVGTSYIGEILYEGYDEKKNKLERTNAAAETMTEDEELFNRVSNSVDKFFALAESKEVVKMSDIEDQLCQNPMSVGGRPQIVFYETNFKEGYCLVYTFHIKSGSNTKVKVAFHIKCGFQWCNAKEKIGVKPQKMPVTKKEKSTSSKKKTTTTTKKKKSSNKGSKKVTKTKKKVKKTKKTKKKTNTPKYNKDPNKAPKKNTEPNDDKGSGPNTNSGGNKSTKEQKNNSNNKSSYKEYKEDVQKKKETNETQKKSGDSNTPSTKPKTSNTNVDNNGDKGTGHGGADTPTPKQDKAKEASSGKEINNTAGDSWVKPSD